MEVGGAMDVMNTLRYMGDRLQIAMVVGSVPTDGSGDISILYANDPASILFGYDSGDSMVGGDVRSLMPPEIARAHRGHVGGYMIQSQNKGGTMVMRKNAGRIMGSWRNLKGVQLDGSMVELQANVADIRNEGERYFVAIFRDRTEEVAREKALQEALDEACESRKNAVASAAEAEKAQAKAEAALQKQDDLTNQVNLLLTNLTSFRPSAQAAPPTSKGLSRRQWVITSCIVAALMVGIMLAESIEGAPVSLLERVLLVFAGVLGTSIAGACDSRRV